MKKNRPVRDSFTEFLGALLRPRGRYGKSLAQVILLKVCFIAVFLAFFYGPHVRPQMDGQVLSAHLLGTGGASLPETEQ